MEVRLEVLDGPYAGEVFDRTVPQPGKEAKQRNQVRIGRGTSKLLKTKGASMPNDGELSTNHARISMSGGAQAGISRGTLVFVDLASSNGSAVDGTDAEEDTEVALRSGSVVRVGQSRIRVSFADAKSATTVVDDDDEEKENDPPPVRNNALDRGGATAVAAPTAKPPRPPPQPTAKKVAPAAGSFIAGDALATAGPLPPAGATRSQGQPTCHVRANDAGLIALQWTGVAPAAAQKAQATPSAKDQAKPGAAARSANAFATPGACSRAHGVIDLCDDDGVRSSTSPSLIQPPPSNTHPPTRKPARLSMGGSPRSAGVGPKEQKDDGGEQEKQPGWACVQCTFRNDDALVTCEICEHAKPVVEPVATVRKGQSGVSGEQQQQLQQLVKDEDEDDEEAGMKGKGKGRAHVPQQDAAEEGELAEGWEVRQDLPWVPGKVCYVNMLAYGRRPRRQQHYERAGRAAARAQAEVESAQDMVSSRPTKEAFGLDISADIKEYMKARAAAVKSCAFKIKSIPEHEVNKTGRTIKQMGGWTGFWPAIREFMQNTVDHLQLVDQDTGRRHRAVTLRHFDDAKPFGASSPVPVFEFMAGGVTLCTISVSDNELVIEQHFTFPLPPRALDTGVPDTSKMGGGAAGGFGDGFKTAAVALLAMEKEFHSLDWCFEAGDQRVDWRFYGLQRAGVGRLASSSTMQVDITRVEGESVRDNVMVQRMVVDGIGAAFLREAVPRLQVFWTLDEPTVVSAEFGYLCEAEAQPAIASFCYGLLVLRPAPGVYVSGIWVREAKIQGAVQAFFNGALRVSGRDRNEVNETELAKCCGLVMRSYIAGTARMSAREHLAYLLGSLMGHEPDSAKGLVLLSRFELQDRAKKHGIPANMSSQKIAERLAEIHTESMKRGDETESDGTKNAGENASTEPSWLTRSDEESKLFLDRVLTLEKAFFLESVFGFAPEAIFVSSATATRTPFTRWANDFLRGTNYPMVPLKQQANAVLFKEVEQWELMERCAGVIRLRVQENPPHNAEAVTSAIRMLLEYLGESSVEVCASGDVGPVFYQRSASTLFLPVEQPTVGMLMNVLTVITSQVCSHRSSQEASDVKKNALISVLARFGGDDDLLSTEDISGLVEKADARAKAQLENMVESQGQQKTKRANAIVEKRGANGIYVKTPLSRYMSGLYKHKGDANGLPCFAKVNGTTDPLHLYCDSHGRWGFSTKSSMNKDEYYGLAMGQEAELIPVDLAVGWKVWVPKKQKWVEGAEVSVQWATTKQANNPEIAYLAAMEAREEEKLAKAKKDEQMQGRGAASVAAQEDAAAMKLDAEREETAALSAKLDAEREKTTALEEKMRRQEAQLAAANEGKKAREHEHQHQHGHDCDHGGDDDDDDDDDERSERKRTAKEVPQTSLEERIQSQRTRKFDGDAISAGKFAKDGGDDGGCDECGGGHSALQRCVAPAAMGGGDMFCDAQSASELASWPDEQVACLGKLRSHLDRAIELVRTTMPGTDAMLASVHLGYDAACEKGSGYYGFCQADGALIIINLYEFHCKYSAADGGTAEQQQRVTFDFLATLTHEMAHALTSEMGHGNGWRHTHVDFLRGALHRKLDL